MRKSFNHKQKLLLIGIITLTTLLMFYFGFNYLKGINVFEKNKSYFATFDNIQGVDRSTRVYLNGFRVGNVREINFDYATFKGAVVELALDENLKIPQNTVAVIQNNPLGGGAIHLMPPEEIASFMAVNDTIKGESATDFMASLTEELLPNLNKAILSIDSLSGSVNSLVNSPDVAQTLAQLNASTRAIQSTSRRLDGFMGGQVPRILEQVEGTTQSLQTVSGQIESAQLEKTLADFTQVVADLRSISGQINSKDGSLGLLLNDKGLYTQLDSAVQSADSLLQDIKAHPKRYLKISIF